MYKQSWVHWYGSGVIRTHTCTLCCLALSSGRLRPSVVPSASAGCESAFPLVYHHTRPPLSLPLHPSLHHLHTWKQITIGSDVHRKTACNVFFVTAVMHLLTSTPHPLPVWASTRAQAWPDPMMGSGHWGLVWDSLHLSECTPGTDLTSGREGRCSPPSRSGSLFVPGIKKRRTEASRCLYLSWTI